MLMKLRPWEEEDDGDEDYEDAHPFPAVIVVIVLTLRTVPDTAVDGEVDGEDDEKRHDELDEAGRDVVSVSEIQIYYYIFGIFDMGLF